MISSCCTLRLKRRSAFSRDSLSWIMTSATFSFPPNPVRIGYVRRHCLVRTPPRSLSHASRHAVTHTANDGELVVPTVRPARICPMDCILTCAPLHGLDHPEVD